MRASIIHNNVVALVLTRFVKPNSLLVALFEQQHNNIEGQQYGLNGDSVSSSCNGSEVRKAVPRRDVTMEFN